MTKFEKFKKHIMRWCVAYMIVVIMILLSSYPFHTGKFTQTKTFSNEYLVAYNTQTIEYEQWNNIFGMAISQDLEVKSSVWIECNEPVTVVNSKSNHRAPDSVHHVYKCTPGEALAIDVEDGFLRFAVNGTFDMFYPVYVDKKDVIAHIQSK